jgi:hypothetical protein
MTKADPDAIGSDGTVRLRCYLSLVDTVWLSAGCNGLARCGHSALIGIRAPIQLIRPEATVRQLERRLCCSQRGARPRSSRAPFAAYSSATGRHRLRGRPVLSLPQSARLPSHPGPSELATHQPNQRVPSASITIGAGIWSCIRPVQVMLVSMVPSLFRSTCIVAPS